jgi:membrane-associated phospholipid phosphatase
LTHQLKQWLLLLLPVCSIQGVKANDYSRIVDTIDVSIFPDSLDQPRYGIREYMNDLGSNLQYQATAPFKTKVSSGAIVAITVIGSAILQEDRRLNRQLRLAKQEFPLIHNTSPLITTLGGLHGVLLLGGTGAYGMITHNEYLTTTVILASQSYITSGLWAMVFKTAFGRTRPDEYNHWTGPGRIFRPADRQLDDGVEFNSFPSGHTTTAFAIASVFAHRYKDRPAAVITAYSLATLVGLSRMTENRHWGSDILAGGLLGYLCGTAVVKNYEKRLNRTILKNSLQKRKLSHVSLTPVCTAYGTSLRFNYDF